MVVGCSGSARYALFARLAFACYKRGMNREDIIARLQTERDGIARMA
jgi:hypothetical protein